MRSAYPVPMAGILVQAGFAAHNPWMHKRLLLILLFPLLFPSEFDARWLRALDARTLRRIRGVLFRAEDAAAGWQAPDYALRSLLDALAYAVSQISAAGQSLTEPFSSFTTLIRASGSS